MWGTTVLLCLTCTVLHVWYFSIPGESMSFFCYRRSIKTNAINHFILFFIAVVYNIFICRTWEEKKTGWLAQTISYCCTAATDSTKRYHMYVPDRESTFGFVFTPGLTAYFSRYFFSVSKSTKQSNSSSSGDGRSRSSSRSILFFKSNDNYSSSDTSHDIYILRTKYRVWC